MEAWDTSARIATLPLPFQSYVFLKFPSYFIASRFPSIRKCCHSSVAHNLLNLSFFFFTILKKVYKEEETGKVKESFEKMRKSKIQRWLKLKI